MIDQIKRKPASPETASRPLGAPQVHAGHGPRQSVGQSLSAAPARPKTFLIVDDDAAFRDRLVRALISRGLQARGAASPADALALARVTPPEAATVDLRMPGGISSAAAGGATVAAAGGGGGGGAASGLDLIRDLLALAPRMQIVVLTGYGNIATAVEAVRRGAIDYLTKPLDTDQILAAFDPAAPKNAEQAAELTPSLARVEWEHIQRILTDCNGNISKAARVLGLHRRSLQRKLGKLPPEE